MIATRYYLSMNHDPITEIQDLIERLARINAADHWGGDLNPAQRAALSYLGKANQYSRAPSQVADYLSAMRGTVSNTLKTLARKGLIEEHRSTTDRRSISYQVTESGWQVLEQKTLIEETLQTVDDTQLDQLSTVLKSFVKTLLEKRSGRSFGICATCQHHTYKNTRPFCALLKVPLTPLDAAQICFEHSHREPDAPASTTR